MIKMHSLADIVRQIRSRAVLFSGALIVIAGLIVFSNGFEGQFFLDDSKVIVENIRLRHILPRTASEWLGPRATVDLTLAINYATSRLNPVDYHAGNLLVHLAAGLVLFGLVRRTVALPGISPGVRRAATSVALIAALTWSIHPLAGAAVQYVCQRYELMAGLCMLFTLYAVLRGATSGFRPLPWYVVSVVSCLVGMSCKETMVITPLLVLIFDRIFLSNSWREIWASRWLLYICLALTVLYLMLPFLNFKLATGVHDYHPEKPSLAYLATQTRVVTQYLRQTVWPYPLCLDYGWTSTRASFGGPLTVVPSLLFVAITIALFIKSMARLGFLGLWFLLLLVPTSSVFPHTDLAFDHRMYMPLAALAVIWALLLIVLAERLVPSGVREIWFLVPALLVATALGVATHERNRDYHDTVQMWRSVLHIRPDNTRAAVCLTGELFSRQLDDDVIATAERVLDQKAFKGDLTLLEPRRIVDVSKLLNNLGLAQLREARVTDAVVALRRAVTLAPGNLRARLGLASATLAMGDTNAALSEMSVAYGAAPDNPEVLEVAADLLAITGRPQESAALYRQALVLLPGEPSIQCRLAWLLATCPEAAVRNGAEALRLAQAYGGNGNAGQESGAFEILAAALAELGDYAHAAQVQSRVIDQLGATPALQARLESYRAGKPWRDERFSPTRH